jgi:hypothetical protein
MDSPTKDQLRLDGISQLPSWSGLTQVAKVQKKNELSKKIEPDLIKLGYFIFFRPFQTPERFKLRNKSYEKTRRKHTDSFLEESWLHRYQWILRYL